ncbi:MAG: hypothetical protein M1269_01810 [Chloroflexi bacterium]|nr:hypothetical protein [Chloroflexota bacterium]
MKSTDKQKYLLGAVVIFLMLIIFFILFLDHALNSEDRTRTKMGEHRVKAKALLAQGNYKKAARELEKVISLDKGWEPDVSYEIGVIYYEHKDYKHALKYFLRAKRAYKEQNYPPSGEFGNASLYYYLGCTYKELGDTIHAVKYLFASVKALNDFFNMDRKANPEFYDKAGQPIKDGTYYRIYQDGKKKLKEVMIDYEKLKDNARKNRK